ncbi:MAG: decaprenyl-phosphate phosphoribosyltransferase [Melioribacter sp.]|nr:decaprenyl-phosphate phosphoribosyltransferase [Melioribacter sp.]
MLLYFRLIRAKDWIKNIFIFVPLVFSKNLFHSDYLIKEIIAFITFSFASSFVYVFNDLTDIEKDKIHPIKRNRPIASGEISIAKAKVVLIVLLIFIILLSLIIWNEFVLIIFFYILINIFYSFFLKNIVIIDVLCISAGFILRVVSGAVIVSIYVSNWLIVTTLFLSLFLAIMKRRVEFVNYRNFNQQREVLEKYTLAYIDQIVSVSATAVIISYALYTVSARTVLEFGTEKLLYTTIFVVYGILRYMYLVFKENKGENIAELILTDKPMLINSLLYIFTTLLIIYF